MKRDAFTPVEPTTNSILIYTHANDTIAHAVQIEHGTSMITDYFLAMLAIFRFDAYGSSQVNVIKGPGR